MVWPCKKDLLSPGLVVDEKTSNDACGLASEVCFKKDTERQQIINMEETHHDLSMTGNKNGIRAILYHKPLYQRVANRSVDAGPGRIVLASAECISTREEWVSMFGFSDPSCFYRQQGMTQNRRMRNWRRKSQCLNDVTCDSSPTWVTWLSTLSKQANMKPRKYWSPVDQRKSAVTATHVLCTLCTHPFSLHAQ